MKTKFPSLIILAAALGFAACAPIPGSQPMQPRADVERIEREGAGVQPSETVGQALSGRNAVDYANDRGRYGGYGGGGYGWGGPLRRY